VWLEVSPSEAARRIASDAVVRPMLDRQPRETRLEALLLERTKLYESLAHHRVVTDGLDAARVADAVDAALEGPR
jgi:shikimate kinase